MERRNLIFGIGSATLLGGVSVYGFLEQTSSDGQPTGQTRTDFVEESDVPAEVEAARSVASEFFSVIREYYPESRVFLNDRGEIVHLFEPKESNPDSVESEIHRIAKLFANTFAEMDGEPAPTTFTIVTGEVQAILTAPVLEAYRDGDLRESAVLETIEITKIERTTSSENTEGGQTDG